MAGSHIRFARGLRLISGSLLRRRRGAVDVGEVLRLLDGQGCVICRAGDDAEATWTRWFVIENHSGAELLSAVRRSLGFCSRHTRRLVTLDSPDVLRQPWEFALRGAIARVETLIVAGEPAAVGPCPPCAVRAARARAAGGLLAGSLHLAEVRARLVDGGGLCYPHLRILLPRLRPAEAAIAAAAVLAAVDEELPDAVAGTDTDATQRSTWRRLVADRPDPVNLPPPDRLIAELRAGSCPCCRAAARAELGYLTRLLNDDDAGGRDLWLCPSHLHDLQRLGEPAPTRRDLVRAHVATVATAATRVPERSASRRRGGQERDQFDRAVSTVTGDDACHACRAAEAAAERRLDLVVASADDTRIRRSLDEAHGLCLHHCERLATGAAAGPYLRLLLTRLRQMAWELAEDVTKQAWELRHEPRGHEATAWRRVPTLLDGRSYLGLAEAELWPDQHA